MRRWRLGPSTRTGQLIALTALAVLLAGCLLAWRGLASGGVDGVSLSRRQRVAVVLAGFGGFIGRGGSAIDRYALLQLVRLHAVVVRGAARSSLHRRSRRNTEPRIRRPVPRYAR
jgi:hypothetical protein